MLFIPNTAVENTRTLVESALPDAPVVPDADRPPRLIGMLYRLAWPKRAAKSGPSPEQVHHASCSVAASS